MKRLLLCLIALSLAGCATGHGRPKLPYDAWYIGIGAPRFMEVWVESVDVLDQRGLAFFNVHRGVHDLNQALRFADQVRVIADGTTQGSDLSHEVITELMLRSVYKVEA